MLSAHLVFFCKCGFKCGLPPDTFSASAPKCNFTKWSCT